MGGGNISENKGSYRVDVTTSVHSPDYEYEAMLNSLILLYGEDKSFPFGTYIPLKLTLHSQIKPLLFSN